MAARVTNVLAMMEARGAEGTVMARSTRVGAAGHGESARAVILNVVEESSKECRKRGRAACHSAAIGRRWAAGLAEREAGRVGLAKQAAFQSHIIHWFPQSISSLESLLKNASICTSSN
jgi:hypothetical protein